MLSSILRADPSVTAPIFHELDGLRAEGHAAIESVVSDTGYGNPPEEPESIFREFEQVGLDSPQTRNEIRLGV